MASLAVPYIPGIPASGLGPLGRYLPPLPQGVARGWLQERLPAGSWILDAFGASPALAIEAARAGYRVLVAANNPISRCLIEVGALAPSQDELRSVLAELAAAHRGEERIEPLIRSLYMTSCASCGAAVMASYFLWERGASAPYARAYQCPACGDQGERPTDAEDVRRAETYAAGGLHRARALERVAPLDDPDRSHAEEALAAYLPRAVYALFTLINKLEALALTPQRKLYLQALLLSACDLGCTLWPYPSTRERPRQLGTPPRFRENNIWLALENSLAVWGSSGEPLPLTTWPKAPPETGGICLFAGPLRDLAGSAPQLELSAALAALPRPNQAFWTLSALWAGWLWGREAASGFKSVLRRRRYDWAWHTAALSAAFVYLASLLPEGSLFLGLAGEAEPGFMASTLIAAEGTALSLEGLALRQDTAQAQITWRKPVGLHPAASPEKTPITRPLSSIHLAARQCADVLRQRGQPSGYLQVYSAAAAALAQAHAFPEPDEAHARAETPEPRPAAQYNQLQALLRDLFTFRGGFLHFGGSDQSPEAGGWWLREEQFGAAERVPLTDRVEMSVVRFLQKEPGCTLLELDRALCTGFPGLLTPDSELVQGCLDSYGVQDPAGSGLWRLREDDQPAARRSDLQTYRGLVRQLGQRLGFQVEGGGEATQEPFLWYLAQANKNTETTPEYAIYVLASAAIGEIVTCGQSPARQAVIVIPGSRANLVAYKLHADARLSQKLAAGWAIIRYRQVRWLLDNLLVTAEDLHSQLSLDPITYSAPQLVRI